jgi:membrane protein
MKRARRALRLVWASIVGFHHDRCFDQAAVVAFYCLLSIPPAVYITGVILRALLPEPDPIGQLVSHVAPLLTAEASSALARLIEHDLATSAPVIALALPGLAWSSLAGLRALERAVSLVLSPRLRRNAVGPRLRVLALVFVFGGALLTSHLVDVLLVGAGLLAPGPKRFASQLSLLAVRFATLALLYRILPRGGASVRVALAGACMALPLWEIARRAFGALLVSTLGFGLVTGTLAGIVTLQLWFYAASSIVLFGAEFAAAVDREAPHAADA